VVEAIKKLLVKPSHSGNWEGAEVDSSDAITLEEMLRQSASGVSEDVQRLGDPKERALLALCEQDLRPYWVWASWGEGGPWQHHASEQHGWKLSPCHQTFHVARRRKVARHWLQQVGATEGHKLKTAAEESYIALARLLDGRSFFAGEKPGGVDAKVYSHLVLHLCAPEGTGRLLDPASSEYHAALADYVRRCDQAIHAASTEELAVDLDVPSVIHRLPEAVEEAPLAVIDLMHTPWADLTWDVKARRMAPYLIGDSGCNQRCSRAQRCNLDL